MQVNSFQGSIDLSLNNADVTWKEEAEATLKLLLRQGNDFSSEDILKILEKKKVYTRDKRALGGLFQRYSRLGYIRFIRYSKATRSSRHNAPVAIWRPMTRLARV